MRQARFPVSADGVALLAVRVLRVQVLCVHAAGDVEAVAVVGRHEDEGLLVVAQLPELGHGGFDGVVEFEEVAQGAVVVERVHLLVDGRGLGHEEEAFLTVARAEDVDGLEGHFLQAGHVGGVAAAAVGAVLLVQVLLVDVAVEPDGQVGGREDADRLRVVGRVAEGGVVLDDVVAFVREELVIVLALV